MAFFNPLSIFQNNISQSNSLAQTVNNNILNSSNSQCISTCSIYNGGNTIIIDGTTIQGNIEFNQTCNLQQSCVINSTLDTQVESILDSLSKQTSVTTRGLFDILGSSSTQENDVRQSLTTNISNLINSTCQSTADITNANNFVYLNNSNVQGSLQFNQTADVVSACTLNNMSRVVAQNKLTASNDQSAKILGSTGLLLILLAIIAIIVIVLFVFNRKKGGGTSNIEISPATAAEVAAVA
jgi:hypothetical protein